MRWVSGFICMIGLFLFSSAQAQVGIGVRMGTLGPGIDLGYELSPRLAVRAHVNYFALTREEEVDVDNEPLRLDLDAQFTAAGVLVDYYPFAGRLRLTLGALLNGNAFEGTARPVNSKTVGRRTYTPEELGSLNAKLSFAPLSGFASLGFGRLTRGSRVGLLFDLGVLYHGAPNLEMTGTGMIAPTAEQAPDVEAKLADYKFYPVLSLGLAVRL